MKILALIPAYNEADGIVPLLNEIKEAALEAVVINDGSKDNTARVARQESFPVIDLPVNLGIGGAVQCGFLYAVHHNYDIVVQIDGDGQHNPALVKELVAPIERGEADCVVGSRYHPDSPDSEYKTPFARRVGMRFSTGILRLATGLTIHDTTSGFRALNRAAFTFFAFEYPTDHPEAEALLLLHRAGFKIQEIPTRMRSRQQGQSLFTFARALFYPLRVLVGFAGILFSSPKKGTQ
jgi:glycosyltransferase involved in cell wall biosynthesis